MSANTHDATVAIDTVDSTVIATEDSHTNYLIKKKRKKKQNLCLDKAYHSKEIEQEIIKRGYVLHIRHRKEEEEKKLKRNIMQQEDGL